ncbi:1,4-dihydroxy-2-naphthoate octaprenyltransferase [bacterium]|nr:1,4-dihydroxy-2-naphthoate octaprenyltransferase [candidate division CSSED10-310 bacterium]
MEKQHRYAEWWKATRPFAFPASTVPVLVGTATAWVNGGVTISFFRVALALIGVMCLHSGANIFNDYFDYKRGVDRPGTLGSSGLLVNKTLSPRELFYMGIVYTSAGVVIGVVLTVLAGPLVLWLGIAGVAGGYCYTGGPALKYRMLGDLSVFVFFGLLVTLGAYYIQTGTFSWIPVLYAIPLGFLIDGILHGNNMRDIADDAVVNVTTFAGRLGIKGSQIFYLVLVTGAFVSIPVLVFADHLPWPVFAVVLSLPLAVRNIRMVLNHSHVPREQFAFIDAMGAQLQLVFGVLMTLGIVAERWVN